MKKEVKEKYIKIYILYILEHQSQEKVADEIGVCKKTVETALKWVAEGRVDIPNETFLRLGIEVIREQRKRLRDSLGEMEKIKHWNAAIAYEKELKTNFELELKLRGLLDNVEPEPSIPSIQIGTLNAFVDTLVKVFNEINELDTLKKRSKALAQRISELCWPEIREPDRSLAGKQIRGRLPGQKLRNLGVRDNEEENDV